MIKDNIIEVLHEMEEVTKLFKLEPFDIYIIGGSACILGEYTTRATIDVDFIDLGYPSKYGKVFAMLRDYDMLEYESTILSPNYKERAIKLEEFEYIKTNIPNAKFIKGVCNASQARQDAINALNDDIDALIIVGGKNSNNSKSLYIAALSKYKNKKVFFIENEDELNKKDLIGLSNIAVASGTSTPDFVVKRIAKYLTSI